MVNRKHLSQNVAFGLFRLLSLSVVGILFAILGFIIYKGIGVIDWEFLTTAPTNGMTAGGILPAIVGTFCLMAGSALFAFPVGVMSGIYMNEYVPKGWVVRFIRMMTNNLSGIPSIVFGLFGMALFVNYMDFGDSILAGSLTLGLLSLPLVIRTPEEALKAIPDSIFDFDQIHLDYFKDLYLHIRHSWEVVNGLTLDVGLSLHRRTEVERSKFVLVYPDGPSVMSTAMPPLYPGFDPSVLKKFRHSYNSFAPRVRVTWTPGQYYYMSGDRKINLYSKYPTVSVDWERGLSGIMNSTGKYERIEVDFQHNIPLGLMRDIYYRLGWGAFTNQKELYFVDFANLARSNLPVGWNDEIGGVFQLLDGRWYNSSREYVRGHFTYEAPFLLLRHLKKYTQYVLNERLYLNALVVPHLNPYLEVGYGIGTHVFDFGVFASFANWKYQEMGVKFTFELFNR